VNIFCLFGFHKYIKMNQPVANSHSQIKYKGDIKYRRCKRCFKIQYSTDHEHVVWND
jgi:hypothetical protein